eukprot:COSAG06_NODE_44876_length_359_cov_1.315385_1_plen_99_part_01
MRSFHPDCLDEDDLPAPGEEWRCQDCTASRHPCFHCGAVFGKDSRGRPYKEGSKEPTDPERLTFKCSVKDCGRFYHIDCVQKLKNSRIEAATKFVCPSH